MFNKTYNYNTDNSIDFPEEINVTHTYAPTTKQIKVLRDIEKEVRKDILSHVRIDNTEFKFNCFVRKKCFDDHELVAVFTLNGKEITVVYEFNGFFNTKEQIREFFKKIAERIVEEFLMVNYKSVEKMAQSLTLNN